MRISQHDLRFSTALAEAEHAVAGDQLLDLAGIGRDQPDADAVAQLGQLDRLQHFREQAPGIEREDVDLGAGLGDGMQDRLILESEGWWRTRCGPRPAAASP